MSTTDTTLALTPEQRRAGTAALRTELEELSGLKITDAAMGLAVGEVLIAQLRVFDEMQKQRDNVTKPLYAGWKAACKLFDTDLDLQKKIIAALKAALGAWGLEQEQLKSIATQEARAALVTGDVQTIERALTQVNAPQVHAQGVSTEIKWQVERLVEPVPCPYCGCGRGMVPREYWTEGANLPALNDMAARHKGEEPPTVPGVIFRRAASVTGRRA